MTHYTYNCFSCSYVNIDYKIICTCSYNCYLCIYGCYCYFLVVVGGVGLGFIFSYKFNSWN